MQRVQECRYFPGRCAVFPQLGGVHPLGYFDTGNRTMAGDHVYVSAYAVQIMAEALGYKRAGDETGMRAENTRLTGRVAELEASLAEAERTVEAVRVLKQAGFSQANPVGRPKKVAA